MRSYFIRRSFLLPLGILLFLNLTLLVVVIAQGQPTIKVVILGGLLLPVAGLFVESYVRRIIVAEDQVIAIKPFRRKGIPYAEMISVETIRVKKRVFLTLNSAEDFLIISNAYAEFPALVRRLLEKVPAETVADETSKMAENPPNKSSDIVSCWFGVILLFIILVLQFVR